MACPVSTDENNIKDYEKNIAWELKTETYYSFSRHLQKDKYMYFVEVSEKNKFFVSKVNLENGKYVWKSEEFSGYVERRLAYIEKDGNGYILVENKENVNLYFIDEEGGTLRAILTYCINEEDNKYFKANEIVVSNNRLFKFITKKEEPFSHGGLAEINIENLDFSIPRNPQYCESKIVWGGSQTIDTNPFEKDGIIYLITCDWNSQQGYTEVIAYDTNTDSVKWEYTSNVLDGNGRFNMYIVDNLLYIIEEQIACFNIESGECIYEYKETEEDLATKISKGGSIWSQGLWYDDGKFYYTSNASWATSSMTNIPEELVRNVLCLDAKTFELVWSDFPEGCGSLFTRPVVIDGKCFVLVNDGLRVYNSKTGELIGRASEVNGSAHALNAEYNGMFIYFDIDDSQKTSTLTAIRP